MTENNRLTIRDVARAAGVSPATVSRALRGLDNVDLGTRDRILAVARELDYAASPAASRLATGRSGTVGIVTPFVGRWYFTEVFAGVEEGLTAHDVDLLLHVTGSPENPNPARAHVRMRRRVDGVLVVGLPADDEEVSGLAALDVPVVLRGARAEGTPSVSIDDRKASGVAVDHLVAGGHERIALITGRPLPTRFLPENLRLAGYLDTLERHSLATRAHWQQVGEFTTQGGQRAMAALLAAKPRPTAVFCMSDEMAYGALRVLREAGLRAGGDREHGEIAVIGFDGHDLGEVFDLSTVAQPVRALGRAAVALLMGLVAGAGPEPTITLPTTLVVRGSTTASQPAHKVTDP